MIFDRPELEVDEIFAFKISRIDRNHPHEYFVHWKGDSKEYGYLESQEALWRWKHKIHEFEENYIGALTLGLPRMTMHWGRGGCKTSRKMDKCVPHCFSLDWNETAERTGEHGTKVNR
jgi:hypothetical protein